MASLSIRQSAPSPSGRAAVGHLGQAQQPQLLSTSGRALVGNLGVGRRYTGVQDLLSPRQLQLPAPPPLPDFARLRADAERLKQQLAAQAPLTPKQAGYPIPFLTPAEQARHLPAQKQLEEARQARERLKQRALADYNRSAKALFLPEFLRVAMTQPLVNLRAQSATALPAGPDSFMPTSFWKSQNPYNDPKVGWAKCCATVKAMMEAHYGTGKIPNDRFDLVAEHRSNVWAHGYRVRDGYVAAPNSVRAARGLALLDQYMALHKPVMVGVSHTVNLLFSSKNRKTGVTTYHEINDGTIDHFVAIVGTGVDKNGKYYRFFDVGTVNANRKNGVSPLNRLYYNPSTGFYEGMSQALHKRLILTQLRF